ncbi:class I SAM-dependent methyltransferase [Aldersonia sp. NBC_00410]|uniref:THUMP-like domain-containing protein n=1 Tax=Aldersonia sp. NBC_00410 TaxID=2975954 RepID=UPI00224DD154|nr:class I SAM-dependent methyltransferase [Aldersonia sp. NBC_00410]MCX5046081.1 class I SAM-dependent methyltransferase [Aldersonia sp. NBC_00410]
MSYSFGRADVTYLSGADGAAALVTAQDLPLTKASLLRDIETARARFGSQSGAIVETVRLRRRALTKLDGAAHWLLTDDALQQATPSAVARHRAARLRGHRVHDVTCSIGAELAELVPVCPIVVGSDLDPVRLAMAAGNVPGAGLVRADALGPCTRATVVLADPARRADGSRTHDPAKLQPPLPDLIEAYAGRDLVVKCAPGLDFDRLDWPGEIEVVSLDGAVREACLWSPGPAAGARRRASVLDSDGTAWEVTDAEPDELEQRPPGAWIVNPDGAVVRAGLVRHYGARHGLWQLDPRIAYLTGDAVPPGARGFRVLSQVKFAEKAIRAELSRLDCGALEILVRGVDVDPDRLRAKLKLRGAIPHALIVTRIGRTATAFVCAAAPGRGG